VINPLAAICAMQMILETLGEDKAAAKIDTAVKFITANKLKSLAAGKMGYSTSQVGDMVAQLVAD
jgi:3-isopropylmalate dehydrogenase